MPFPDSGSRFGWRPTTTTPLHGRAAPAVREPDCERSLLDRRVGDRNPASAGEPHEAARARAATGVFPERPNTTPYLNGLIRPDYAPAEVRRTLHQSSAIALLPH